MKKIFFIAVIASVALAGCTIDERNDVVKNESRNLITFTNPLMKAVTRGETAPETGPIMNQDYNVKEYFHVYAVHTDDDYQTWGTSLFMDTDVYYKDNSWVPVDHSYYWPQAGKLTFAAYSPTKATVNGTISYDEEGLKIKDFENPALKDQYDLMYAKRVYNKTYSNTTNGCVDIVFDHALSLIHFSVASSASDITLTGIEISNLYNKGNFNENITVNDPFTEAPEWTSLSDVINVTAFSGSQTVSTKADVVDASGNTIYLLMIPQKFDDGVKIKISYTYKNGNVEISDYKEFQLNNFIFNEWKIGTCYIYNITIGLKEITFNPSVTAWPDCNSIDIGI